MATFFSLALLGIACQSIDESNPSTGSSDSIRLTLSLAADEALGSTNDGSIQFVDDGGTLYTMEQARVYVRDIELDLPGNLRCIDFVDLLAGGAECKSDDDDSRRSVDDDSDDDRTIIVRGPFVIDLMTGEATPSLADVRVPSLAYSRIDVRIEEGELDEGVLRAGDELIERSLAARARAEYMETPIELVLLLDFNEDIRFEMPAGVPSGPMLDLTFDVASWLRGVPVGECLDDGDLGVEGGVLRIGDNSGFGDCSDVENTIKENIKRSGQVRD